MELPLARMKLSVSPLNVMPRLDLGISRHKATVPAPVAWLKHGFKALAMSGFHFGSDAGRCQDQVLAWRYRGISGNAPAYRHSDFDWPPCEMASLCCF